MAMNSRELALRVVEISSGERSACGIEFAGHRPKTPCQIARNPSVSKNDCGICLNEYHREKVKANHENSFLGYSHLGKTECLILTRPHNLCGGLTYTIFMRREEEGLKFIQTGEPYCEKCRALINVVAPEPSGFLKEKRNG